MLARSANAVLRTKFQAVEGADFEFAADLWPVFVVLAAAGPYVVPDAGQPAVEAITMAIHVPLEPGRWHVAVDAGIRRHADLQAAHAAIITRARQNGEQAHIGAIIGRKQKDGRQCPPLMGRQEA